MKEAKAASAQAKPMSKEEVIQKQVEKKQTAEDKELLDRAQMLKMSFAEKLNAVKETADGIIYNTERKYRKINDLILFTEDPKDVDIVLKAVQ